MLFDCISAWWRTINATQVVKINPITLPSALASCMQKAHNDYCMWLCVPRADNHDNDIVFIVCTEVLSNGEPPGEFSNDHSIPLDVWCWASSISCKCRLKVKLHVQCTILWSVQVPSRGYVLCKQNLLLPPMDTCMPEALTYTSHTKALRMLTCRLVADNNNHNHHEQTITTIYRILNQFSAAYNVSTAGSYSIYVSRVWCLATLLRSPSVISTPLCPGTCS